MKNLHCTICYVRHEKLPLQIIQSNQNDTVQLANELSTIFIVKKLLGLPDKICEDLLIKSGNPSSWGVTVCHSCLDLAHQAQRIHEKLYYLKKQLKTLRSKICEAKIIASRADSKRLRSPVGLIRAEIIAGSAVKLEVKSDEDYEEEDDNEDNCLDSFEIISSSSESADDDFKMDESDDHNVEKEDLSVPVEQGITIENNIPNQILATPMNDNADEPKLILVVVPTNSNNQLASSFVSEQSKEESTSDGLNEVTDQSYLKAESTDVIVASGNKEIASSMYFNSTEISGSSLDVADEVMIEASDVSSLEEESEEEDDYIPPAKKSKKTTKQNLAAQECTECDETFKSKYKLNQHMELFHPEETICNICEETFKSKKLMLAHYYKSHNKIYDDLSERQCLKCNKTFPTPAGLKIHNQMLHSGNILCDTCGITFESRSLMMNHMKEHIDKTSNVICELCPKTFRTDLQLKLHQAKVHSDDDISKHQCLSCNKTFLTAGGLKTHNQMLHSGNIVCETCEMTFESRSLLMNHMKEHIDKTSNFDFICELCSKTFRVKHQLKLHQAKVHADDDISKRQCLKCNKTFLTPGGLKTHNQMMHSENSNRLCETCGMTFESQSMMMNHMKEHIVKRPYLNFICELCPKTFRTELQLTLHQAKAHGYSLPKFLESKFKCKICGEILSHGKSIRLHMEAVHAQAEDDRPHKCTQCPYCTFTSWQLRNHVKYVHDGVARKKRETRQCPKCPVTYKTNASLYGHLKKVHGEIPEKKAKRYNLKRSCPHCKITVKNINALSIHLNTEHGENHNVRPINGDKPARKTVKRKRRKQPEAIDDSTDSDSN